MRLSSKLTSLESRKTRVLFSVLFLLAVSSCSVAKQPWSKNRAQQNLDVNRLSASVSGGNNTVISNTHSRNLSLGGPTSTAQQSDINGKTSPALDPNGVRQVLALPRISGLEAASTHSADILGIFLPPAERARAVSVDTSGLALLWNLADGQPYRLLKLSEGPLDVVAFNALELLMATARENEVKIYSLVNGSEVAHLSKLKTRAISLGFQPSGQSLVIGGADGEVYRWRFVEESGAASSREAEKYFERYFGHANVVSSVAYHPIGRIFFSGDWSGALSAWLPYDADVFSGKYVENVFGMKMFSADSTRIRAQRTSTASIEKMAISADGETLLVGGQDGALEWWQVRGFTMAAQTTAHKGLLYDLAVAPSGKIAATIGRDGQLRIWKFDQTVAAGAAKVDSTITKIKELSADGARKLMFLDDMTLIVADHSGRIAVSKL